MRKIALQFGKLRQWVVARDAWEQCFQVDAPIAYSSCESELRIAERIERMITPLLLLAV